MPEQHVDLYAREPLSAAGPRFLKRLPVDDPMIGKSLRDGDATYAFISEPHTMAECPERVSPTPEPVDEREWKVAGVDGAWRVDQGPPVGRGEKGVRLVAKTRLEGYEQALRDIHGEAYVGLLIGEGPDPLDALKAIHSLAHSALATTREGQ